MVYVKMVNSQGLALSINSKRELALAFSFVFANLFRYMPLYGLVRSLFSEVIVSKGYITFNNSHATRMSLMTQIMYVDQV